MTVELTIVLLNGKQNLVWFQLLHLLRLLLLLYLALCHDLIIQDLQLDSDKVTRILFDIPTTSAPSRLAKPPANFKNQYAQLLKLFYL